MALIVNEWKYEWIKMQHWWNDGDSDIQLESHCIVSSFLVKLLNVEWRGIHHGYSQNVLKHYRNMLLWLSNMPAVAHSSKQLPPQTRNHSHVILLPVPPDVLPACHINHRTHNYYHHNRYNLSCFSFMMNLLFYIICFRPKANPVHYTTTKNNWEK